MWWRALLGSSVSPQVVELWQTSIKGKMQSKLNSWTCVILVLKSSRQSKGNNAIEERLCFGCVYGAFGLLTEPPGGVRCTFPLRLLTQVADFPTRLLVVGNDSLDFHDRLYGEDLYPIKANWCKFPDGVLAWHFGAFWLGIVQPQLNYIFASFTCVGFRSFLGLRSRSSQLYVRVAV